MSEPEVSPPCDCQLCRTGVGDGYGHDDGPKVSPKPTWNPDKCAGPWDGDFCPYSALAMRVWSPSKDEPMCEQCYKDGYGCDGFRGCMGHKAR